MSSSIEVTREHILGCIRRDLDRAYKDAQKRLDQPTYMIHGGMATLVEVRAASDDGQKVGKFYRVGLAPNRWEWEVDE